MKNSKLISLASLLLLIPKTISTQTPNQGYFIRDEFSVLSMEIFLQIGVFRDLHCGMHCLRIAGCKSYNVATERLFLDGLFDCQLFNYSKREYPDAFTPSKHYHHYTKIMTVCQRNDPCLSGSTCVPLDVTGFNCLCPKAYTGQLCETVKWLKINSNPVCFGTKDNSYGQFYITVPGQIITFKLVHVSGSVSCNIGYPQRSSHWGCKDNNGRPERMITIVTDNNDKRILPQDEFFTVSRERLEYNLPGYDEMSKEVIFKNISIPLRVRGGDEFRVWYGQDLTNLLESNNGGRTCCDVYGLYE